MGDPLRAPIISRPKYPIHAEVRAALNGEVLRLCDTREIDRLYRAQPDFTSRSTELHKIVFTSMQKRFESGTEINLAVHCHDEVVSLVLQVNYQKGRNSAPADAIIPMSARRNLEREGAL